MRGRRLGHAFAAATAAARAAVTGARIGVLICTLSGTLMLPALGAAAPAPAHTPRPSVPPPTAGQTLHGTVSKVYDGDSLWLTVAGRPKAVVVRLQDIDAPEFCQAWGQQARDALAARVLHRTVVLQVTGTDPHRRTLGRVWIEGEDVGPWMVRQGHAWSLRRRPTEGASLLRAERRAQAQGLGLHASPDAEPPWLFRRRHGPCQTLPRRRSR